MTSWLSTRVSLRGVNLLLWLGMKRLEPVRAEVEGVWEILWSQRGKGDVKKSC